MALGGGGSAVTKHLTRRVALADLADAWNADTFTGPAAAKWASLRAEIEGCLAAGGELWEWESEGLRQFAGTYGVAVVKEGSWVREWCIGRS
jgi:hypothetical protein